MDSLTWPQPKKIRQQVMTPWITHVEHEHVMNSLKAEWVSSTGPIVESFESKLSAHLGQETISVANGSVALILALASLEIGPGDEVLVPNLTFAAVASSVLHVGAIPVFVDVSELTWNLSLEEIMTQVTMQTKAIIVVHSYGVPADIISIVAYCDARGIAVIEDVAEAFDSRINGKQLGTFGDIGTYSFFANKLITTGEGGAITASSQTLVDRLRLLRGQGMDSERRYWFLRAGFNFRMGSLQAALGVGQLERFDEILAKRIAVETCYSEHLEGVVTRPGVIEKGVRTPWIFTGVVNTNSDGCTYRIAKALASLGFESRPVFYPLSSMPAFGSDQEVAVTSQVSESISRRGISLPSSHLVTLEDIQLIASTIKREVH